MAQVPSETGPSTCHACAQPEIKLLEGCSPLVTSDLGRRLTWRLLDYERRIISASHPPPGAIGGQRADLGRMKG